MADQADQADIIIAVCMRLGMMVGLVISAADSAQR
jgi:hypothetical protein